MQKLDRLLSSPRPQSATYLGASSTQNSEISTSYPSPTLAFAERGSSTMFHARVYRRYNTVYQGTWPSKRILSASIGISGPVFLRENRGDRVHEGQTSKAILTPRGFSGLMEMRARRIRSKRRKSKKSCPLPPLLLFKDHPRSPPPRAAWDYFSDRQPEATGLIIETGIEAETEKGFSEVCRVIVEISSLFSFFSETFRSSWDFVALASRGLYECSL